MSQQMGPSSTTGWDNDSQDEDQDDLPPLPLSPLGRAAFRESVDEFKTILKSIDYEETTDLTFSFAYRAHLEHLVDRYWNLSVQRGQTTSMNIPTGTATIAVPSSSSSTPPPIATPTSNSSVAKEATTSDHEGEVLAELKEMVVNHPFSRVSPLLMRWPLLASDVPRPAWTLSDEVLAIMEQQRKKLIKGKSRVKKEGREDALVNPIDADLALPTITTCQHALMGILHDLARRRASHAKRRTDKKSNKRDVIINWRDVLSIISSRSSVPKVVFEATQKRLHSIYGQVTYAPPPSWAANIGLGGKDRIFDLMKSDDAMPSKWHHIPRQRAYNDNRHTLQDLDRLLLLPKSRKRARYLEPAPTNAPRKIKKRSRTEDPASVA